jgi:hypothetical protein
VLDLRIEADQHTPERAGARDNRPYPGFKPRQHPATNLYPDQSGKDFASGIESGARIDGLCGTLLAVKQDLSEGSMIESNSTEMQPKAARAWDG